MPGLIEAENFDLGGEGVAYHDNVPGNAGGQYRASEDVDIILSADCAGGDYVVNNFETGEWLEYTIDVPTSGFYSIELRASNQDWAPAPQFRIEIEGRGDVTGSVTVPTTGLGPVQPRAIRQAPRPCGRQEHPPSDGAPLKSLL